MLKNYNFFEKNCYSILDISLKDIKVMYKLI